MSEAGQGVEGEGSERWVEHMCSPSTYPAQNNAYAEAHPQVYSHINDIYTQTQPYRIFICDGHLQRNVGALRDVFSDPHCIFSLVKLWAVIVDIC